MATTTAAKPKPAATKPRASKTTASKRTASKAAPSTPKVATTSAASEAPSVPAGRTVPNIPGFPKFGLPKQVEELLAKLPEA